eukprot:Opistho-1_new@80828
MPPCTKPFCCSSCGVTATCSSASPGDSDASSAPSNTLKGWEAMTSRPILSHKAAALPMACALQHFEDAGRPHAAANAHGHRHALGTTALAFDEGMAGQALAAHAVGVAHRNGAAVHIQAVGRDAQLVAAVQHLHRKGLVQLPQVDVIHCEAQALQHLGHGEHRANAHIIGLAAGHGEAEETAQRLQALLLRVFLVHQHTGTGAVGELAGVAGRHHTPGHGGFDAGNGFLRGAFADAFVLAHRDLLGAQAHDRVGHAGGDGDGGDFGLKQTGGQGRAGALLALCAVLVHRVAANAVALGHLLGGLQHVPVDLGLFLGQVEVAQHVGVHFLLHAGDAFHAPSHIDLALAGDDALRGHRDGLQAGRAEAVDRHARGGDGQAGAQRDLARD